MYVHAGMMTALIWYLLDSLISFYILDVCPCRHDDCINMILIGLFNICYILDVCPCRHDDCINMILIGLFNIMSTYLMYVHAGMMTALIWYLLDSLISFYILDVCPCRHDDCINMILIGLFNIMLHTWCMSMQAWWLH